MFVVFQVQCLCLFVTHYPCLSELEQVHPAHVRNYHMAFMLHRETSCDGDEEEEGEGGPHEELTFLYQCISGAAQRSFGLNVARLADIPPEILAVAAHKSRQLEMVVQKR